MSQWLPREKIPTKVESCPIIEAIFEIRFTPRVPANAIYGMIYRDFVDNYGDLKPLPILQIPEPIRSSDQGLRFKPYYAAETQQYILKVGPKVISLSCKKDYAGWEVFSERIRECCESLKITRIIQDIHRVGLRYINFFSERIYDIAKLGIKLGDSALPSVEAYVRANLNFEKCQSILQVSDNVTLSDKGNPRLGSIVDIDVYVASDGLNFDMITKKMIEECHEQEKQIFFSLLSDEFLRSLKPDYPDPMHTEDK